VVSSIKPSDGELVRARLPCFVQGHVRVANGGEVKRQRLCFWSFDDGDEACQGGSHEVEIAACVDLSATYFCHKCKGRGVIVDSPIQAACIRPMRYDLGTPEGFEDGYIDYEANDDFLSSNASPYMRDIGTIGGRLFTPDSPRTVVLHGGMGTGKSTIIQKFLDRLRDRKTGKPSSLHSHLFLFTRGSGSDPEDPAAEWRTSR
jgi:hypothetical protein